MITKILLQNLNKAFTANFLQCIISDVGVKKGTLRLATCRISPYTHNFMRNVIYLVLIPGPAEPEYTLLLKIV